MGVLEFTGPFKVGDLILNEYEVIGLLGVGGHAYVYECLDRYMEAVVAVKVISSVLGRGKDLLSRAHAEAKLLFKLNHPNVVRVITARPLGDAMVCIVMEKLEGLSLRQFLRFHGRLTATEALHIVRQIAVGVGAAHQLDVIHRDIKPENVFLLPPNSQVKVLDFGIAKFLGQGLDTTNKARIHGTPYYMSPEHLQGLSITVRSDIFELGTLAFELMTGKLPCRVDLAIPDFHHMEYVQFAKVTPPLTQLISDIGPGTEYLVQRATAKDPTQRFKSMDEVIAAVDAALLEQRTLYPRESETVRHLDDAVVRAARLQTDEDGLDDDLPSVPADSSAQTRPGPKSALELTPIDDATQMPNAEDRAAGQLQRPGTSPVVELDGTRGKKATGKHVSLSVVPISAEPATTNSATTSSIAARPASTSVDVQPGQAPARRRKFPSIIVLAAVALGLVVTVAMSWSDIQRFQSGGPVVAASIASQPSATFGTSLAPIAAASMPSLVVPETGPAGTAAGTLPATSRPAIAHQPVLPVPRERRTKAPQRSSVQQPGSSSPLPDPQGATESPRAFATDLEGLPASTTSAKTAQP